MPRKTGIVFALVVLGSALNGCSVVSSLQFDDRLLVKVPVDRHDNPPTTEGWNFRHVAEGPTETRIPLGQWYLVWPEHHDTQPHFSFPWSRWVFAREHALEVLNASKSALGEYPTMIEPDFVFSMAAIRGDSEPPEPPNDGNNSADQPAQLEYSAGPSPAWPNPFNTNGELRVAWQLDDDYTQLRSASDRVFSKHTGPEIRIGILDNGFSAAQAGVPEQSHLIDDPKGDAVGELLTYGNYEPQAPGSVGSSHGTGTIGILAGRKVFIPAKTINGRKIAQYRGYLGGAPHATIVPARIAPWVFSLTTANLAYGIDYASRVQKCDVISLSHGGAPCEVWVDAVNAAYERGTAMFAAESDFYSIVPEPIEPRGFILPSSPVYPASFRRVMGVAGVTSEGDSYGENSLWRLLTHPLSIGDWVARGSYGPKGSWRTPFGQNEQPDAPTVRYQGLLRAYPISAYSPNIPWLVAPSKSDPRANLVDLYGAGTSAATPQVAAAAALWLDFHRDEFTAKEWTTWVKAEAVYDALLESSQRKPGRTWPDLYLGAGTLKAGNALNIDLSEVKSWGYQPIREDGKLMLKYTKAAQDYYDGDRSFASLFGLAADVPYGERADLDQLPLPNTSRQEALVRLLYNTLLLQKWHGGHLPKGELQPNNVRVSAALKEKAKTLAQEILADKTSTP